MLITKKEELCRFNSDQRLWQGVPGIERTAGGRTFITFYSGGVSEQAGNFAVVLMSDNDADFTEPIAAAFKAGEYRCFDSTLWIDPLGRLWFIWSVTPGEEVFAAICNDPDAERIVWEREFYIGRGVMLNKPTVLSSGEWLFPIALWDFSIRPWQRMAHIKVGEVARSNVYKSVDNGKTFTLIGGSEIAQKNFDEHSIVELSDGRLMMTVRTDYGTGKSYSYDRGRSWTRGENAGFGPTVSRIHIRRLPSGKILRISHDGGGRTNLTAYLSEDDGKTYPYKLLLDDRKNVSYPDATLNGDGYIYIVYDRERGNNMGSLERSYECAREILTARITEDDIISGEVKSERAFLRRVVSKLGPLADGEPNPYTTYINTPRELADAAIRIVGAAEAVKRIFEIHPINSDAYHGRDGKRIDTLVSDYYRDKDQSHLVDMISILHSYERKNNDPWPLIESVKSYLKENLKSGITLSALADHLDVSSHYISFLFTDRTGCGIFDHLREMRLMKAKLLLSESEKSISRIGCECGLGKREEFEKEFLYFEGLTPTKYRKYHKK